MYEIRWGTIARPVLDLNKQTTLIRAVGYGRKKMKASPGTIYGFTVKQMPIGAAVTATLAKPVSGVLHTTEGSTAAGAANTFHVNGNPSHFAIDSSTIIQFRPLDQRAMALRHSPAVNVFKGATNAHAVQIEIAGFSKTSLWIPDSQTVDRVAAVIAYASLFHGIPLSVPNTWPDNLSDVALPWAARNSRRIWAESNWPTVRGWWQHMEIPGQGPTWHWDCGALRRSVLLQKAQALINSPAVP